MYWENWWVQTQCAECLCPRCISIRSYNLLKIRLAFPSENCFTGFPTALPFETWQEKGFMKTDAHPKRCSFTLIVNFGRDSIERNVNGAINGQG